MDLSRDLVEDTYVGTWTGANSDKFNAEDTQDRVAMLRAYINTAALLAAAKEDMDYYRKEAPEMAQEVTLADLMVEQLSEVVRALEDDAAVATFVKELDK